MAAILAFPALACDDHHGKCEIDGWRYYDSGSHLTIEGSASCDSGLITIRLFDGNAYLANASGFVVGHTFTAYALNTQSPANLTIKYSIDPDF